MVLNDDYISKHLAMNQENLLWRNSGTRSMLSVRWKCCYVAHVAWPER